MLVLIAGVFPPKYEIPGPFRRTIPTVYAYMHVVMGPVSSGPEFTIS